MAYKRIIEQFIKQGFTTMSSKDVKAILTACSDSTITGDYSFTMDKTLYQIIGSTCGGTYINVQDEPCTFNPH